MKETGGRATSRQDRSLDNDVGLRPVKGERKAGLGRKSLRSQDSSRKFWLGEWEAQAQDAHYRILYRAGMGRR